MGGINTKHSRTRSLEKHTRRSTGRQYFMKLNARRIQRAQRPPSVKVIRRVVIAGRMATLGGARRSAMNHTSNYIKPACTCSLPYKMIALLLERLKKNTTISNKTLGSTRAANQTTNCESSATYRDSRLDDRNNCLFRECNTNGHIVYSVKIPGLNATKINLLKPIVSKSHHIFTTF